MSRTDWILLLGSAAIIVVFTGFLAYSTVPYGSLAGHPVEAEAIEPVVPGTDAAVTRLQRSLDELDAALTRLENKVGETLKSTSELERDAAKLTERLRNGQ